MKNKELEMIKEIIKLSQEHLDLLKSHKNHNLADMELMKVLLDNNTLKVCTHRYDGRFYVYSEVNPIIEALKVWETKKGILVEK